MTTGYVVNLDNGHDGYCIEWIPGITLCGEVYSPSEVDREVRTLGRGDDHPQNSLCIDCYDLHDPFELRAAARELGAEGSA